jgi:hypothetical protein
VREGDTVGGSDFVEGGGGEVVEKGSDVFHLALDSRVSVVLLTSFIIDSEEGRREKGRTRETFVPVRKTYPDHPLAWSSTCLTKVSNTRINDDQSTHRHFGQLVEVVGEDDIGLQEVERTRRDVDVDRQVSSVRIHLVNRRDCTDIMSVPPSCTGR